MGMPHSDHSQQQHERRPHSTMSSEQRGERRPRDALARSLWTSRLVFSGSDAMSDCIRRLERAASHGAKNSHSIGSAKADVQRQSQPSAV